MWSRSGRTQQVCSFTGAVCGGLLAVGLPGLAAAGPDSASPAPETIVVQGQKLSVRSEIDRKIYSVPEDAQTTLGTLSDILNVVPSIDVDPDGVVSLRGDTNVLILIDGKPATQLKGSKSGDNLQSIPASDIERIEVLTAPPPQFKAAGSAGVINIITRRHAQEDAGFSSLTASLGNKERWLVGGHGGYSSKHFATSLSAGFREDLRERCIDSTTVAPDAGFGDFLSSRDHSSQTIRRNIPNVAWTGEYHPNERQSWSSSLSWIKRGGLRTYRQFDSSVLPSGVVTSSTERRTSGHDPEDDYNATLAFSQKFRKPGETLDLSLHRSISHQHEHYDYVNESFVPPAPVLYDNLDFAEHNAVTEADLDYVLPLGKSQSLKIGYAYEQDDYHFLTAGFYVDPAAGTQTLNPALASHFLFHQTIHAMYQTYQGSAGPWTWLAGVRTEWTNRETSQVNPPLATTLRYSDLFPSLHVDRSLSDRSTLSLGASRRVTRPDPDLLNPYLFEEYPPNFTAGNPYLRPEFTESYEFGYAYQGRPTTYGLTAYYRRNKDSVTDVTAYLGNGLTVATQDNLEKNDAAGLEFSASGRLFSKLGYNLSGNAFYAQIDARALGTPGLRSTTGVNAKAKLDYQPTAEDSAEISYTRTDRRLTPQGSVSAIHLVNVGYKHTFSPSLSAVVTLSDLFDGQRYRRVTSTLGVRQDYERRIAGRVAWVGLTYTLGLGRKEKGKESEFEYDSGAGR